MTAAALVLAHVLGGDRQAPGALLSATSLLVRCGDASARPRSLRERTSTADGRGPVETAAPALPRGACVDPEERPFRAREGRLNGDPICYRVFVPAGWSPDRLWPVIFYLHGAAMRGDDNAMQTRRGLGPVVRRMEEEFPFVVVFPQCPPDRWWTEPAMQVRALDALEGAIRELHGDPDRLYLTGQSMGGAGTWSIAARNPGRFAALAPVAAGVSDVEAPPGVNGSRRAAARAEVARRIGKTAVWTFHGSADDVVPVSEARAAVAAVRAAGGDVKYSEYAGMGHDAWDRAYAEPELYRWMLAHSRTAAEPTAPGATAPPTGNATSTDAAIPGAAALGGAGPGAAHTRRP